MPLQHYRLLQARVSAHEHFLAGEVLLAWFGVEDLIFRTAVDAREEGVRLVG